MKTVRMKRTRMVEGLWRRAGDLVACLPLVAQRLVNEGAAEWTVHTVRDDLSILPAPPAHPVSPNRMKFASLVKALDPHADDFAERVAQLQDEYQKREGLARELARAYCTGPVEDLVYQLLGPEHDAQSALDDVVRTAIERFVVDRY